jgi:hypothetical protein
LSLLQLKEQTQATGVELIDAQRQVVAGMNYKLTMKAVGGTNGDGNNWLAVVFQPLGGGEDTVTSLDSLTVMSPGAMGLGMGAPGPKGAASSLGGGDALAPASAAAAVNGAAALAVAALAALLC